MQPVLCKGGANRRIKKAAKAAQADPVVRQLRQYPWTPLSLAVVKGQLGSVKVLLELGADMAAGTGDKEQLLRLAIDTDKVAVANFLMKLGKVRCTGAMGAGWLVLVCWAWGMGRGVWGVGHGCWGCEDVTASGGRVGRS